MARRRLCCLALGVVTAAATLLPPAGSLSNRFLAVHMLRQMVLLAAAAPLLAYAIGPTVGARFRVHPVIGLLAFNAVLFTWQLPAFLNGTSRNGLLNAAAQAAFLAGCLCFWWPVVRTGLSPVAKIGYLLVAGVPPTIPGMVLAFSRHLYYAGYSSLDDQHLAGLLLFGTAKFALVGGTFVILWRMLAAEAGPSGEDDGRPALPETPPSAPAWLSRLDDQLPAEPAPSRRRPVRV